VSDLRILWVYADQYLDGRPECQRKLRDLIAKGRYRYDQKLIEDSRTVEEPAEFGLNYVLILQPEDGPEITLPPVGWSKTATADKALLDAWTNGAPADLGLCHEDDADG
jgi:hypothetical protein